VPRILLAGNGNPLALELLTKEWLAHGSSSLLSDLEALNTQPVANIGIPRAIGAVFDRQIRRLDAPTRAALDLAAVLGRRLADLPLYEVVELSPAAAGEALSRLKEEGFLREVHGGLEFRNELIRAQAKAESADSVLSVLSGDGTLPLGDRAKPARLQAAVQYLLNREPGPAYCAAADAALSAARETGDPELIGNALFECARSGANSGDESRVVAIRQETERALAQLATPPPIFHYTEAYCAFFSHELATAASALETAISLLKKRVEPASLSLAYTGYGTCKQGLCEFDAALAAYN